ncbi:MAG: hypothetical protein LBI14_05005 [Treponema sp.]|jgi:hypothetical protein|nr:hypothetical protein [Treponema sp.]
MASVIKPDTALFDATLQNKAARITGKEASAIRQGHSSPLALPLQAKGAPAVPASVVPAPAVKAAVTIPAASSPLTGAEVFKAAVVALGLPQDALSNALLAFTRFFSISPDTALLANLRKEVLASGSSSPKTAKEKAAMESRALAASAAFDKGVTLSEEGLDEYAAVPSDSDSSEHKRREGHFFNKKDDPDAEELKKSFAHTGQNEGEEHFLDLLNRIPGKNGQRWVVWPFNYGSGGTELSVLVRILIKEPISLKEPINRGLIIADIVGPQRKWHFVLDRSGPEKLDVNLFVFPGFERGLDQLQKEIEKTLKNLAPETECHIWNDEVAPSLIAELGIETLPSINEEV